MATAADQDRRLRPDQRNAFLAALLGWTMDVGSYIDKAAVASRDPDDPENFGKHNVADGSARRA
jgi:hypothetical protein